MDKLSGDQVEKINLVKKTIVENFEDTNLSKMLHTLIIIDDIEISYVTRINNVDYRAEKIQSLRSNNF